MRFTTVMQEQVPLESLSRVSAYDWLGSLALLPTGLALVGTVAESTSISAVLVFGAIWMVASTLAVLALSASGASPRASRGVTRVAAGQIHDTAGATNMRILVIGGTLFLGRHVMTAAAAAGHDVTVLHRGQTTCPLPDGVEELLGDRTADVAATLGDREWDLVVDTSGQDPETVGLSVAHLAQRTRRYLFVSTVSVYADVSRPGITEDDGPLNEVPADGDRTPTPELYGALNAAAERVVLETFGDRGIVVRPGLIGGRWDPTNRFGYWAERVLEGG